MPDPSIEPFIPVSEGLRRAYRSMAAELRAELLEHETHVLDCAVRLSRVLTLLAVLDAPATPETKQ